ncbi:MAG TPA: hypothetical protein VN642_01780 [Dongiaceae bacterium]|nr:hypothetical protein [Dongiaceae bacterium]
MPEHFTHGLPVGGVVLVFYIFGAGALAAVADVVVVVLLGAPGGSGFFEAIEFVVEIGGRICAGAALDVADLIVVGVAVGNDRCAVGYAVVEAREPVQVVVAVVGLGVVGVFQLAAAAPLVIGKGKGACRRVDVRGATRVVVVGEDPLVGRGGEVDYLF